MKNNIQHRVSNYITAIRSYLASNDKLESFDDALLESLESSYKNMLIAENDVVKSGLFTFNRFGDKIANPAVKIANDARIQMNKVLEHLDVTIKQRYKNRPTDIEETSPLDNFLNNNQ